MNNLLMINYIFPPLGGSGGRRAVKFAKYLREFGWEPIVLTTRSWNYHAIDESLWKDLPGDMTIYRCHSMEFSWLNRLFKLFKADGAYRYLSSYVMIPDEKMGNIPFGYRKGMQIAREKKISAIFSTSWPYSSHLIAYLISRKTGIPWVADFRDEWLEFPTLNKPTPLHRYIQKRLEKMVIDRADKVIATSETIADNLKRKTSHPEKVSVITNGFDRKDLEELDAAGSAWDKSRDSKVFNLTYAGALWSTTQNIAPLFSAISSLLKNKEIPEKSFKVNFVGHPGPPRALIEQYGLQDTVSVEGYLPHKLAIERMLEAQALFFFVREERAATIPEKSFEYLAVGKPILAIAPPGSESAKLVSRLRAGVIADYREQDEMRSAILGLYNDWKAGRLGIDADQEGINAYDRRSLTKRLAFTLDLAVSEWGQDVVAAGGAS